MAEIIYGAVGAMLTLGVFLLGFFVGRRCSVSASVTPEYRTPPGVTEAQMEERRRLIDEDTSFKQMLKYNIGDVYGTNEKIGQEE